MLYQVTRFMYLVYSKNASPLLGYQLFILIPPTSIQMQHKKRNLVIFTFLFSSIFTFSQVNLGTAANFALFTAAGAFDNIGPSMFVGDIGTHAGDITGFPPGMLTGDIQQANPITLQAAEDVENAYNYVTGIPCDSVLSNALGGGQILTPNVYCIGSASMLSGELILDAEGISGSVFIIKVTGVLDVIAFSTITLINSASVHNVYWQIDGAINIYNNANFKGSFLVNGAITVYDEVVLNGNGLSRVGAITTISVTSTIPNDTDLPIELTSFKGTNMHTHNVLVWSTASETNNNHFTLERTTDGYDYTEIMDIKGSASGTIENNYTYSDHDFEKTVNYYRLTQTDYDGEKAVLGLVSIDNYKAPTTILRVTNLLGQDVDSNYIGIRLILFSNGDRIKVSGKYTHYQ
jgi:hypothetical protein